MPGPETNLETKPEKSPEATAASSATTPTEATPTKATPTGTNADPGGRPAPWHRATRRFGAAGVIIDLDGTLLDTAADLAAAVNAMLAISAARRWRSSRSRATSARAPRCSCTGR